MIIEPTLLRGTISSVRAADFLGAIYPLDVVRIGPLDVERDDRRTRATDFDWR